MKLFVWDLHGTLEEGNERAVIEISNQILDRFGYSDHFLHDHIRELYGLKWYQYFEFLLPQAGHERHLELQAACFELSNSIHGVEIISRNMKPSVNAIKVLSLIAESHKQVLISNTVPESLPIFINALNMNQFFNESNSLAVNAHAKDALRSKRDALLTYIQDKMFDDFVIVGDSDGDMELAELVGGRGYLYSHRGVAHRSSRGIRISDLADLLIEV